MTMTWPEVLAALVAEGITTAEVKFSGGGDSGGVDSTTLWYADGREERPALSRTYTHLYDPQVGRVQFLNPAMKPFGLVLEVMEEAVYNRYPSFNNDPQVDGTVVFDTEDKTVVLTASESYSEYLGSGENEDEDEETIQTDEIEEVLYDGKNTDGTADDLYSTGSRGGEG